MKYSVAEIEALGAIINRHDREAVIETKHTIDGAGVGWLWVEIRDEDLLSSYTISPLGRVWSGPPGQRGEQLWEVAA